MEWTQTVMEPLRMLLDRLLIFIPRVFGALLILGVGWVVASVCRQLIVRILLVLRIDRLAEKAKLTELLHRGAIRLSVVEMLGQIGYWIILLAAMIVALQYLGLSAATEWLERLSYFIPRIIVSLAILLFGMLVASFLSATVRAASLNAGLPQGHLLGQVVYVTAVLLTAIMALEQLQVVTRTIEVALYIFLAALGLATA